MIALLAPAALASDDAARAVVDKGIKAQGGAIKLERRRWIRIMLHGTAKLPTTDAPVQFIMEEWRKMPDQYENTVYFHSNGQMHIQRQTLDGKNGFDSATTRPMSREVAAEMLARKQATDLDRLDFLSDKDCQVTSIPDAKVEGRDAAGVLVQPKGRREVKLYFDKETGLLVKREYKMLDSATGKQTTQEVIFGDYRKTDGVKRYQKLTAYRDGEKFMDARVIEMKVYDDPGPGPFYAPDPLYAPDPPLQIEGWPATA
jgi:hypothetical protein